MLDTSTLRMALGGVTLIVVALFYMGAYRPTRSTFAGWWTVALLGSAVGSSLLLLNGTSLQVVANPLSNVASTSAATCIWFATRSLRTDPQPRWVLVAGAVTTLATAIPESPGTNVWAGNWYLFLHIAGMFTAAAVELWRTWTARRRRAEDERHVEAVVALLVTALAGTVLAAFYTNRTVLFLTVGVDDPLFEAVAGPGITTLILLCCLVAVTFTVSAIGWDQQTRDLRQRASSDDLTGLLGRTAFFESAQRILDRTHRSGEKVWFVIADLDHFKALNDSHGHAAGDTALLAFGTAVTGSLGPHEVAGRLGGEEFGLVLVRQDEEQARNVLRDLGEAFAFRASDDDRPAVTVSYGIALVSDSDDVATAFEKADRALYQAKDGGRDMTVVYEQ